MDGCIIVYNKVNILGHTKSNISIKNSWFFSFLKTDRLTVKKKIVCFGIGWSLTRIVHDMHMQMPVKGLSETMGRGEQYYTPKQIIFHASQ